MTSHRYSKRTKIRPSIRWDSPGLFCAVVIVATLGSLHVNGEKDLCDKFKSGELQIVLMAQTNDTFYILAADNTGYKAPLEMFHLSDDTASLDLSGLLPFTLDTKGYNLAKRYTPKGVFLSWSPLGDTKLRPWIGLHVAFLSEDHKQITFVPIDNEKQDKVLNFAIDARQLPSSNVFISVYYRIYTFAVFSALENKLIAVDLVLASNEIRFELGGHYSNYSMSTVDSGWNCGNFFKFCGIKNAEKKVLIFPRSHPHYKEPTVVPFEDFFQCQSDIGLKGAARNSNGMMTTFGIAVFLLLVLIVLFVLCCFLGKDKSKQNNDGNVVQKNFNVNPNTYGISKDSTANGMAPTRRSKYERKLKIKKAGGKAKSKAKSSKSSSISSSTFSAAFMGKSKYNKISSR